MSTTAGTHNNTGDLLNTLIELTHDVSMAFEAAVPRTDDEALLKGFHRVLEGNAEQIAALKPYADRLSQNTSDSADAKGMLNKGQVRLAGMLGESPLLGALCRIQRDMVTAYGRAVQYDQLPEDLRDLFKHHLTLAEGHLQWLESEHNAPKDGTTTAQRDHDRDEIERGRAAPRTTAEHSRIDQSTDY